MKKKCFLSACIMGLFLIGFSASNFDEEENGGGSTPSNKYNIPNDDIAGETPELPGVPTTIVPNFQLTMETDGDDAIVRVDLTGIQDVETLNWLKLVGTGYSEQNLWIEVDGTPKSFVVYNKEDENEKTAADLVFLVDNSGSMGEEANAVARDIVSWANKLEASDIDIHFGCVGYSEYGTINGGINLTDANSLSNFLNRSTGTRRTVGFEGADAEILSEKASAMTRVYDECGGMALRYADQNFSFRLGANRIYVNFTDEPNQPNRNNDYSVEFFKDQENWNTTQGTVHTVYSDWNTSYSESIGYREWPWRISEYTGGTVKYVSSSFADVTLEDLPVTGAMQNSYIIRFTNVKQYMDGLEHDVKITILSADGKTCAQKTFKVTFTLN